MVNPAEIIHLSKQAFWDVDMKKLDYETHANAIIRRVFDNGSWEDILEVVLHYGKEKIIAAMKMEAITGRKEKKDFIDVAVLLREYEFKELLSSFRIKYPFINHKFVIESLTAIDFADESVNPEMIINYKWEDVKKDIQINVEQYFLSQLANAEKLKQDRLNKAEELLKKRNINNETSD